jgi:hypothetical protein
MNAPAPALHPPGATRHLQSHGYRGLEPGPRLIVTGAVHGNETCGTRGIERVVAELARGEFEIVRGDLRAGVQPAGLRARAPAR